MSLILLHVVALGRRQYREFKHPQVPFFGGPQLIFFFFVDLVCTEQALLNNAIFAQELML